jgi:biopolymer transport protein ExbD
MAGGGDLGGGGGRPKRGKQSKRKKKKRVGFRIDMTPLVDITFLLLTFFMFVTTLTTPQIMDMAVPPETEDVKVAESKLFTVRVRADGKLFYNQAKDAPQPIAMKDLRNQAIKSNLDQKNELITVLKIDDNVSYDIVVNVLDELNLAEIKITQALQAEKLNRERKFTIAPMTDQDKEEINGL